MSECKPKTSAENPYGKPFVSMDILLPYTKEMSQSYVQPYNPQSLSLMYYKNSKIEVENNLFKYDGKSTNSIELSQSINNSIEKYLKNEFDTTNNSYYNRGNE